MAALCSLKSYHDLLGQQPGPSQEADRFPSQDSFSERTWMEEQYLPSLGLTLAADEVTVRYPLTWSCPDHPPLTPQD